jgi:Tetratricopeptide repeat
MAAETPPDIVTTLLQRVRDAAHAPSTDERAWALVRMGSALREAGRHAEAITILEDAVALRPSWDVERAALTCAISTHCDAGNPVLAAAIGKTTCSRGADAKLLRAAGRANAEAHALTRDGDYQRAADVCFRDAALLDGSTQSAVMQPAP